MESKISIITAIYNVEPYLRQCVDSLVGQTLRDIEIILVDDGSTDNCGVICDEYAAMDTRVKVIHKKNGGLASAWNCGLDHAKGEYITFCDGDDWVDIDYYERLLALVGTKETDIFIAGGYYNDCTSGERREEYTLNGSVTVGDGEAMEPLLVHTLAHTYEGGRIYLDLGHAWDKLYRREHIVNNHLRISTSVVAKCPWIDTLFSFQAIDRAKTVRGGLCIGYHYRTVPGSFVRRYNPDMPEAYTAFLHEVKNDAISMGNFSAELQQALYARAVSAVSDCMRRTFFHPQNQDNGHAIAVALRKMRNDPLVHEAIFCGSNKYFSRKAVVLKYALRQPWAWPLKLLCRANAVDRARKGIV